MDLFIDKEADKEITEIQCSKCATWTACDKWIVNRVNLDPEEYGKMASHVRLQCPVCMALYDHRDKKTLELDTKQEVRRIG